MSEQLGYKPAVEKELFQPRKVVITGMGAVTPLGIGVEQTWNRLVNGESGISSVSFPLIRASVAGVIKDFDPVQILDGLITEKDLDRMSLASLYSLVASREALQHAGLIDSNLQIFSHIDKERFGVRIGTGYGGAHSLIQVQEGLNEGKRTRPTAILKTAPERISTIPSMIFGLKGPNSTPSAACATGNVAIVGGYQQILLNDADIMLVGGTEGALNQVGMSLFDASTLSKEQDPSKASRPFDEKRDGFVFSEGAGVLVLESEEHALARGANILGYIGGYGESADAEHETAPNGEGARRALRGALRHTKEMSTFPRLYVNAHGTGTVKGDPIEMNAIRDIIPEDYLLAVSSTKSSIGHTCGAAGAIETIFCVKALETDIIPPTLHNDQPIEEAKGVNIVPNEAQHIKVDGAVNDSFGFGGINSVVTVFRYPGT